MAIVRPENMNFTGKKFSMIISGSPGVGKTTLALSAPNPVLIDFDDGVSRVRAQHRAPTIVCRSYGEVLEDLKSPEMKDFDTIVIDTGGSLVTFIGIWAREQSPGNGNRAGGMSPQGWGAIKNEFLRLTNMLKYELKKNIIYIFHTREDKDKDVTKQRLVCEGSAKEIVWQPCDIGCFLYMHGDKRVAGFTPTEEYFAKGTHGVSGLMDVPALGADDKNDFISNLFVKMKEVVAEENKVFEADKAVYEKAMEAGRALVAEFVDVATANAFTKKLKAIEHALTSQKEIGAMAKKRIAELKLVWNKKTKAWEAEEIKQEVEQNVPDNANSAE